MPRFVRILLSISTVLCLAAVGLAQELPVIQPAPKSSALSVASPVAIAAPSAEASSEEHWQVLLIGDERIGYTRTRMTVVPAGDGQPERLRTATDSKMIVKRFGQEITIGIDLVTTETNDGDLLGYTFELGTSPTGTTRSVGTIEGNQLRIDTTIAGSTQTRSIPWDSTVKSPAWQDRLLREEGIKPGETKTFRAFVPEFNQIGEVRIAAHEKREVKLPGGRTQSLLKAQITQSLLPTVPMTAWFDDGRLVMVETDLLGQRMRAVEVSRDESLRNLAGAELDLAVSTLTPATALDRPHETKRVTYRVHVPGEDAAQLFIESDLQHVAAIDRETVEITVTAIPVSRTADRSTAAEEFTKPTAMLQSNDATIREHVLKAVSPDRTAGDAAIALERYVHEKLAKKNFTTAFASAAEVADSLEGDCSEHAVLLAALLRARQIPSRVTVGLVYVPGQAKMGGHMWTEALLDGVWVPLDATLGRGGIGGGHLKVADSSLADDAPLPLTAFLPLMSLGPDAKIDVLKAER